MDKNQLELLVKLQDLDLMLEELDDVKKLGFDVKNEGADTLQKAREELIQRINKPLLGQYERLRARYKRAIVPVKEDTCLGCFMRLPTYLITLKDKYNQIIICESCGRILYWLE